MLYIKIHLYFGIGLALFTEVSCAFELHELPVIRAV
jgi:hypothetical protein